MRLAPAALHAEDLDRVPAFDEQLLGSPLAHRVGLPALLTRPGT